MVTVCIMSWNVATNCVFVSCDCQIKQRYFSLQHKAAFFVMGTDILFSVKSFFIDLCINNRSDMTQHYTVNCVAVHLWELI